MLATDLSPHPHIDIYFSGKDNLLLAINCCGSHLPRV